MGTAEQHEAFQHEIQAYRHRETQWTVIKETLERRTEEATEEFQYARQAALFAQQPLNSLEMVDARN
eukprot:1072763-Pyramimonas_sp.AAC.1